MLAAGGVQLSEREMLPSGKCDSCRKWRRRGKDICCIMCRSILHVKCGGLSTRGRADTIARITWESVEYVRQSEERERGEFAASRPTDRDHRISQ